MNLFNFFRKKDVDISFVDVLERDGTWAKHPPVLAKNIKPLKQEQIKTDGQYNFVSCPGIHDYSRLGYIIPSWTRINIKANRAGALTKIGSIPGRAESFSHPVNMSTDIPRGSVLYSDNVPDNVWNVGSPWRISAKNGISCLILPATFHNPLLNNNIFAYPGIVDYSNGFGAINLIFSIIKKCEFCIEEGQPLLHVIPFYMQKDITADYGLGTRQETSKILSPKYTHESNFYRKYFMIPKKYKLKLKENV